MEVKRWIERDESASEMLSRISTERPFLLLPPLHRLPLRVGNVVELVGPSSSAKTLTLIQAVISCILPKEWCGVHYGGLGRAAMFIDLDCRFDVLCLSQRLKHRIMEADGTIVETNVEPGNEDVQLGDTRKTSMDYVEELHTLCMSRFLYVRCYDSLEFLATLKTLQYQLNKVKEAQKTSVYLLMIDSIGAFHWVDRALSLSLPVNPNRKSLSLQSVSEAVVREMRKLLLVHPMLVIATKAVSMGDRFSAQEVQRKKSFQEIPDFRKVTSSGHKQPYREYMPAVWQSFVTHRILVCRLDDHPIKHHQDCPVYLSEWLLPPLNVEDKFIIKHGFVNVVQ